jgi:hypothetical protein
MANSYYIETSEDFHAMMAEITQRGVATEAEIEAIVDWTSQTLETNKNGVSIVPRTRSTFTITIWKAGHAWYRKELQAQRANEAANWIESLSYSQWRTMHETYSRGEWDFALGV